MKVKIKKLLFEYSRNSRISTKELGKKIGASQQSASYLKNQLKKRNLIEFNTTIVDAVKLGLVNVLVGFNYLKQDSSSKNEIINGLKEIGMIIGIEEGKEGVDLLIEFSAPNLAAFNKVRTDLISKFDKQLRTSFVFPMIINYKYLKNYLSKKFDDKVYILYGDRIVVDLSKKELELLYSLVKNPEESIVNLSEKLKISAKSLIKIKKDLEQKQVIKAYTSIFNNLKLGINRQIIFLRFSSEGVKQIEEFKAYTRRHRNIIQFMKLIGEFQTAIVVESLEEIGIIQEIRTNFSIENYRLIKSEKIHKKKYLPDI